MPSVFLVSDTHFGHAGVCRFTRSDGITKLRPWDNADEMDEFMVKAWNERVKPTDKVYHLGDVVINRKALGIMRRLNGDKVLIRGNHDIFRDDEYREHFRELRAYHVINGMILSHIPIHSESIGRFGTNIHGHTHANRVMKARGVDARTGEVLYSDEIDPRYHNVSVEQLPDFAPILFEDVIKRIEAEGGTIGFRNGNGPQGAD
jgi:calcineurin-like phosphoesterase family protein